MTDKLASIQIMNHSKREMMLSDRKKKNLSLRVVLKCLKETIRQRNIQNFNFLKMLKYKKENRKKERLLYKTHMVQIAGKIHSIFLFRLFRGIVSKIMITNNKKNDNNILDSKSLNQGCLQFYETER